jgi:HEAT repeat protein
MMNVIAIGDERTISRIGFHNLCRLSLALTLVVCVQLAGFSAQAQDLNKLVSGMQSTDDNLRRAAGNELFGLLGSHYVELIPLLTPLASSANEQTQYDAGKLLLAGSITSEQNALAAIEATAAYTALLASSSARVRVVGVEGLAIGYPDMPAELSSTLIVFLQDPDPTVQAATGHSLGRLSAPTPAITAALLTALTGAVNADTRAAAAAGIGELRITGSNVIDGLIASLADAEPFVRQHAIRALGQVAGAAEPALEALRYVRENGPRPLPSRNRHSDYHNDREREHPARLNAGCRFSRSTRPSEPWTTQQVVTR